MTALGPCCSASRRPRARRRIASGPRRSWWPSRPSRARSCPTRSWTGPPTTWSSTCTTGWWTAIPRPTSRRPCSPPAGRWSTTPRGSSRCAQGVKFHNGEPFNAQSVKATMDYIKDPANKTHYMPRWAQVKEVQIVNDYTVRFVTEKPWPGLIDRIAGSDFLPMPPKALKEQGVQALAAKPIGTGAVPLRAVGARREARGRAQPRLLAGRRPRRAASPSASSPSSAPGSPRCSPARSTS